MMDRPNAQSVPINDAMDAQTEGWDPYAVWRERVLAARRPVRTAAKTAAPALAVLPNVSTGWDPHETWRVRRPLPERGQ